MNRNEGWICPRCGAVNSPWMLQCNCKRPSDIKANDQAVVMSEDFKKGHEEMKRHLKLTPVEQEMFDKCHEENILELVKDDIEKNSAVLAEQEKKIKKEWDKQEEEKEIVKRFYGSNAIFYVTRDRDGELSMFENEPRRYDKDGNVTTDESLLSAWDVMCGAYYELNKDLFPELKWEDEPMKVKLVKCVD